MLTGKGANSTISYVHYFLGWHGLGETEVQLHANNLVDKLVECGKTRQWAREIKQLFCLSKKYLKGDYTRSVHILSCCLCGSDITRVYNSL